MSELIRKQYIYPIDDDGCKCCHLPPPPHTQIECRCFTCKKREVCQLKSDYLKTALLMQKVLGDPNESYEVKDWPPLPLPHFPGFLETDFTEFPQSVKEKVGGSTGIFYQAKWESIDIIRLMYKFGQYFVVVNCLYNHDKQEYEVVKTYEIFYDIEYTLDDDSIAEIQLDLEEWRKSMKERSLETPDVIDTTHFAARLDCQYYEHRQGCSYEQGIREILCRYPNGEIPLDLDGKNYYHIATYHIEPSKVPMYKPRLFYPVPPPPQPPKICKQLRRRDDYR